MKRLVSLLLLLTIALAATAQTYRGTMTFGNYTQRNVEATLTVDGKQATLMLKQVKFSRMMPVKVDVRFEKIDITDTKTIDGYTTLTMRGDNIVPMTKKGRWDKYSVSNGRGTAGRTCHFECTIGDRKVSYNGTIISQK